ncbi:hypothetical protein NDU88_001044 [Pleurodeles waltl]|uniref:Uncharacterized protein n=1 Tax=Pleurodeles waltl TaxID=8319 RepID=A0AAV7V730_PLEWA|nr:hypothetical protein NDU88_001044 [Pleurodeles waltl]
MSFLKSHAQYSTAQLQRTLVRLHARSAAAKNTGAASREERSEEFFGSHNEEFFKSRAEEFFPCLNLHRDSTVYSGRRYKNS